MNLLALHGFTGCGADFAPLNELCASARWHCPELPGHGPEPELNCSPDAVIALIQRSIGNFQKSAPNVLLGYSAGARAALLHATQSPGCWDALILISPNPGIESESARRLRQSSDAQLADSIEAQGVAEFLKFWQQTAIIRTQQNIPSDWLIAMQVNRLRHSPKGLAQSLRQFGQGSFPNLWPKLNRLHMPVLLLTGELDKKYTDIAQKMPLLNKAHHVIAQAGHCPHLEQTESSAAAINAFLKTL